MTPPVNPLDALAMRCGIQPEFKDARGTLRLTSETTRRALLRAMGIDAGTDAAAAASLATLEQAAWRQALPPVCVLHENTKPWHCPVVLPRGTEQFTWRINFEDGRSRAGTVVFAACVLDDYRQCEGRILERRQWPLVDLPCGYHELVIDQDHRTPLIVAPATCWLPPEIAAGRRRLWGLSAQLYLLRSKKNWGIGDYGDLLELAAMLRPLGADVIGLNPLHALFLDDPEQASPYSPASRLLLNVLNIDVAQVVELTPEFDLARALASGSDLAKLEHCRETALVDYSKVKELKIGVLRRIFELWIEDRSAERWQMFERFRRAAGQCFEQHVTLLAMREHFASQSRELADWHRWPENCRHPKGEGTARFVADHGERVAWHAWLQYLADRQLTAAAAAASTMAVGLYRDLAVGADGSGAETWSNHTAVVQDARVGAPPDIHNPAGQNWGLPPFHPQALRNEAYKSFIELIRANMRHAGGLRIDHVMALRQLYWIPEGASPADGAYVRYPLADLVGILKLESMRHECLIVGEDLGTVPEGFREQMEAARILSYRVLFFEKDETGFIAPADYPHLALAVAGSHDMPTLRAWWRGSDLDLKERLHLYPQARDATSARQDREEDQRLLTSLLRREGLIGDRLRSDQRLDDGPRQGALFEDGHRQGALFEDGHRQGALFDDELHQSELLDEEQRPGEVFDEELRLGEPIEDGLRSDQQFEAAHRFLASTASAIALVQLDDVTDEQSPVNVPTTSNEHPNWRRKMSLDLDEIRNSDRLRAIAELMRAERVQRIGGSCADSRSFDNDERTFLQRRVD